MNQFEFGHRVGERWFDFPHTCPGDGCAVERWCQSRVPTRERYEPYDYNVFAHANQGVRDRFWFNATRAASGCWEWVGTRSTRGYGRFFFDRYQYHAHRVAYVLHHGSINPDLVIDHLCRNTSCVNPAHLEAVTQSTNVKRSPFPHWPPTKTKVDSQPVDR